MVGIKSVQMVSGKSFEFAILLQFIEKLRSKTTVQVVENSSLKVAQECFESCSKKKQTENMLYASFAVNCLIDLEPRLSHDIGKKDILELAILSDNYGEAGDVRDVLAIRNLQKWEIGVSAKNHHRAIKHSRLSASIDFGDKWLGIPCSKTYMEAADRLFGQLQRIKSESGGAKKWNEIGDYHSDFYVPILTAFKDELLRLYMIKPKKVSGTLLSYLIGLKDFYKVIKGKDNLEIQAFNLHGTLNLPFGNIEPKYRTPVVSVPTKIEWVDFIEDSKTTLVMKMNNNWALSFRIHNASSRVEPSLKFDINLLESPKTIFTNRFTISNT